ncbi:MAG: hypothetical protein HY394_04375 [Candidatus Diapherotrites archaeon]|nr:hypothetical protein [Candidatus Diapherotrites archaeon]
MLWILKRIFAAWHDFIRLFLVKTNGIWPFSFLNKKYYSLCTRLFVFLVAGPQVESVYLYYGMGGRGWFPGDSDIDFLVVLKEMPAKAFAEFQKGFFFRFGLLSFFFPMLEVPAFASAKMLSDTENFSRVFDSAVHTGATWHCVHGKSFAIAKLEKPFMPFSHKFGFWHEKLFLKYFFADDFSKQIFARKYFKICKNISSFLHRYEGLSGGLPEIAGAENSALAIEKSGFWIERPGQFLPKTFHSIASAYTAFYSAMLKRHAGKAAKVKKSFFPASAGGGLAGKVFLPAGSRVFVVPEAFNAEKQAVVFVLPDKVSAPDFERFCLSLKENFPLFRKSGVSVLTESWLCGELFFLPHTDPFALQNFIENAVLVSGEAKEFVFLCPPDGWVKAKCREFLFFHKTFILPRAFIRMVFRKRPAEEATLFFEALASRVFLETGDVLLEPKRLMQAASRQGAFRGRGMAFAESFGKIAFRVPESAEEAERIFSETAELFLP